METEKKYATLGNYVLIKTLGSGYSSKVKLGQSKIDGKYYALKILKKSFMSASTQRNAKNEINVLKELNHLNIVNIMEAVDNADYIKKNGEIQKVLYIVIELAPGGELFDYVATSGKFSEQVARYYFHQLLDSLEYVHAKGYAHRDLKPENLLFAEDFKLKIADFGFSTLLAGKDGSGKLRTVLGTESYMAPEIHARMPYSGVSVDLFASGIILFIMIAGTPPFGKAKPDDPYYRLLVNNMHDKFWYAHSKNKPNGTSFFSAEFKNLIDAMLAYDPNQRPSIAEIKAHSWYNGLVPTDEQILQEFTTRYQRVDSENQKARLKKEQEKVAKKENQNANINILTGHKAVYREGEVEEDERTKQINEMQKKYQNLKLERKVSLYTPVVQKCGHQILVSGTVQETLYSILISLAQTRDYEIDLKDDSYKLIAKKVTDNDTIEIKIKVMQVEDNVSCIQFNKIQGIHFEFLECVNQIRNILYEKEESKDQL